MKIHYISHLFEDSGWGRSCKELALALDSVGVELTCSPVILGKAKELTGKFSTLNKLLGKNIGKCDYVIQYLLPHHWQYCGGYKKNVGVNVIETSNLKFTKMLDYMRLVDEVWTCNKAEELNKHFKVKTIPWPVDLSVLENKIPKLNIPQVDHKYKFYTLCEYSSRKNIWSAIRSFYRSFTQSDNVCFIIKTYSEFYSSEELKNKLEEKLVNFNKSCGISNPPEVHFITEYFTTEQINSFHKYCDCFVLSSFGEAWSYPMVDALMFGNKVISAKTEGPEYLSSIGCEIDFCDSTIDCYFGEKDRIPGYHTLYEDCHKVNEISMSKLMVKNYLSKKDNSRQNIRALENISFENVGRMMCEQLLD